MRFFHVICICALLASLSACAVSGASAGAQVSPQPQTYLENKGSDTIVNLALAWAEKYQELHPEVRISVTGGGSGTGITALINNTVDIANASRKIKAEEIEEARKKGIEPVEFTIARDAIAVIVHPGNPVERLTLQQISAIYTGEINNWSELGGEDRPIVRLSRETNSGTHVYFLEEVIRLGDKADKTIFSADTLLLPSSEGIIAEVSSNPNAIGYDGLGYITSHVKMLAVAGKNSQEYTLPSIESVNAGTYPISRDLYMYTNGQPKGIIQEYLDWIHSSEAQEIVRELGFVPILETSD
ncbi:MAG: phosphate ABC transporter substrate-binding protein [Anaerolineae bacterium]|nr:phosphate ABC transporter substrate-binding protein [Anaerolineae bacterium]